MNTVTPADADAFEQYVLKWQARLNLNDWRIVRSPQRAKGAMAEVHKRQLADRLACYRIGVDWKSTEVNATTLEQTAVHELLHVFFFELIELAKDPATHPDTLTSAEHRVINVLERLLVPPGETP